VNYLAMFDSDWLRHCDLDGRARVVTIAKVEAGEVRNVKKKDRRPIVYFKEFPKPLALNKTNGKAIATLFTNETDRWVGQKVELYPARTTFGSDEVDCVRVRAAGRSGRAAPAAEEDAPPPAEAEDTGEAPTGGALVELRETFKQLTWKRQQQDMWCKERFGRIQEGLTSEQLRTAFKLLYVWGTPEKYQATLAEEQAAGRCK
jgi:hypothetical protein